MRHQSLNHAIEDSQILSALQQSSRTPGGAAVRARADALLFDACHVGVVLRALLLVESVAGVVVMFDAQTWSDWMLRLAVVTGGALPATLLWLILACSLKQPLSRRPSRVQYVAGVVLGGVSGLYGCGLLMLMGFADPAPWAASALAGALMAALLVAALVWRVRALTPATTTARLTELQSRIRPHFLFNTLNTAIALVRDEPAQAEAILEDLAELFRHALIEQGTAVPLAQEIMLARRYLEIEQARFGERLRITWAIDPIAGAAQLPPLLLQPLVENAVKHGVEPSASGADIQISTQCRGDVVVIKVTNTVPAGQGVRGHGLALNNVRDRLDLLHDVQGSFHASLIDGVYQVRIQLPLSSAQRETLHDC